MSNHAKTARTAAHGHAADDHAEARTVRAIMLVLLLVVAVVVAVTWIWGLPGLTMVALAASGLVMVMLIAYAAGF